MGVGIASTKTLAKLANHIATKPPEYAGVGVWEDLPKQARDRILKQLPVSEVWGIGRQFRKQLQEIGIANVWDLRHADPRQMRKRFNILMERIIPKLRGES